MEARLCLFAVALIAIFAVSEGSHGRYGSITFTKDPTNALSVTFTFNAVFRRSYFGAPNIGDSVSDDYIYYGDGNYVYPEMVVTSMDLNADWISVRWIGTHTYASAGDYNCEWSSCCRIYGLNNDASYSYAFTTNVHITAAEVANPSTVNDSPVSTTLPIVTIPYGQVPFTLQLSALDPENDQLTFAMATPAQMGEYDAVQPTGLSVSSSGLLTFSSVLAHGYWTTQQVITDSFGNYIVVDYLLNVQDQVTYCAGSLSCHPTNPTPCVSPSDCVACNGTCLPSQPAIVFDATRTNLPAPGSAITVSPNQNTVISFVVEDVNFYAAPAPHISVTGLPAYASITKNDVPCNGANGCTYSGQFQNPALTQITLNPSPSSPQSVICIGATSLSNSLVGSQYCVTIDVIAAVCGNGIVEAGESCDGGACCSTTCQFVSSAQVCRESAGVCDVAETCTGSSAACPADSVASTSTVCRAATDVCDAPEMCDGTDVFCPADAVEPSTQVCRPANGTCDQAEYCTGASNACPLDTVVNSTACMTATYVCPRISNKASGSSSFYCSSLTPSKYFMCYTQFVGTTEYDTYTTMSCPTGSHCNCPFGVDCSCGGTQSPCTSGNTTHTC